MRGLHLGGCGGNGNNFETLDACAETCGQLPACEQPIAVGPCAAALTRWAFNADTGACETFLYSGCGGNDNNYLTEGECQQTCTDQCLDPCATVACQDHQTCEIYAATGEAYCIDSCDGYTCPTGSTCTLVDVTCVNEPCPPVAQCIPDVTDPCANRTCFPHQTCRVHTATNVAYCADTCAGFTCPTGQVCELVDVQCIQEPCPATAQCVSATACQLAPDPGPCNAALPRFAYDGQFGGCSPFTYGGCGGNDNNFTSLGACQAACEPVSPCALPVDVGVCSAQVDRWAFNDGTRSCEPFTYSGCAGNENNFETQSDCEAACEVDPCTQTADPGPCDGAFER